MSVEENSTMELKLSPLDFWLTDAFKNLQSTFHQKKFPHGLLINGASGFGQLKLANALAASLLCENTFESEFMKPDSVASSEFDDRLSEACGKCKSCLLLKANTHPDFNLVERLIEKGKLKQNISINQIRELSQKLLQTSQLQGWRIAIINSVEHMNIASFNALLKTLEEPGQGTLMILISNGLGKVPATIKSRTQVLNLSANKDKSLHWLNQHLSENSSSVSNEQVNSALENCYGAPYASLNFIQAGLQNLYYEYFKDLDAVLSNQLTVNDVLVKYKEHMINITGWTANYFHHVSKCLVQTTSPQYKQVSQIKVSSIYDKLVTLNRAQTSGSNLQLNLQLEAILIHWFELGRKIVHYSNR
ncbi:MAG: hypothetical protein ACPGJI_04315 [Kangiellaceae bacterium]